MCGYRRAGAWRERQELENAWLHDLFSMTFGHTSWNIWRTSGPLLSSLFLVWTFVFLSQMFFSFSPLTPIAVLTIPTSKLQQHKDKSLTALQDYQIKVVETCPMWSPPLKERMSGGQEPSTVSTLKPRDCEEGWQKEARDIDFLHSIHHRFLQYIC